jgi:hypothetical protein
MNINLAKTSNKQRIEIMNVIILLEAEMKRHNDDCKSIRQELKTGASWRPSTSLSVDETEILDKAPGSVSTTNVSSDDLLEKL